MLGFEFIKELYACDTDFAEIYAASEKSAFNKFYKHEDFCFEKISDAFLFVVCVDY